MADLRRISFSPSALATASLIWVLPAAADMTNVESENEAYDLCSAYLMADLHYFDQNNGDGDMDMAFEHALNSFVTTAVKVRFDWEPEQLDKLIYQNELIPLMLPIFRMMERQDDESKTRDELQSIRSFCADLGSKHEETRWVFQ